MRRQIESSSIGCRTAAAAAGHIVVAAAGHTVAAAVADMLALAGHTVAAAVADMLAAAVVDTLAELAAEPLAEPAVAGMPDRLEQLAVGMPVGPVLAAGMLQACMLVAWAPFSFEDMQGAYPFAYHQLACPHRGESLRYPQGVC